ncbi:MAG TPA: alpha-E domain-containing protein, partial [Thermoanaerobaculia bacterium]|nr:alpha-E domain-containing protein [Thermoanaerobaculia bacterium]
TYRRRYFARPQLAPVLDLLLLDDTNTRALAFQLAAVSDHVRSLPRDPQAPTPTREERLIEKASTTLQQLDPDSLHREGVEGARRVMELLGSIGDDLRAISETITYFYFSHAELRVS